MLCFGFEQVEGLLDFIYLFFSPGRGRERGGRCKFWLWFLDLCEKVLRRNSVCFLLFLCLIISISSLIDRKTSLFTSRCPSDSGEYRVECSSLQNLAAKLLW